MSPRDPTAPRGRLDVPWSLALITWVGVIGPTVRVRHLGATGWGLVLVGGLAAAVVLVLSVERRWWLRSLAPALAAAAVVGTTGEVTAVWLAIGLSVGSWVATEVPPVPGLPPPAAGSTAPVVVLSAVAIWKGADPTSTWQVGLPVAAAAAMPALGHVHDGLVHRTAARLGDAAGAAVASVAFAALWIPLVLIPWSFRSLVRDPLGRDPGWLHRSTSEVGPRRMWAPDRILIRRSALARVGGPLLVVAVGAVAAGVIWSSASGGPGSQPASDAFGDGGPLPDQSDWYSEYQQDIDWVLDERVALRPFEVYRVRDVRTRYVNVQSGVRSSWSPPECECRRLVVWMYGGGSAFGLGQRDEHTIASELARRADREGLTVDVVNRGVPGQMHWRGAFRFAYDLTYEQPPDMVVFYDGADEVDSAIELVDRGLGDTRAPFEPFAEELYESLVDPSLEHPASPVVEDLGWPTVSDRSSDDPGTLAVARYERHRRMSADTARSSDVPVRYFWQPVWYGRDEATAAPGADDARRQRAFEQAAEQLPSDVVDLSSVFEGQDGAIFTEESVHGERGAALVADAIYESIRADLVRAAEPGS